MGMRTRRHEKVMKPSAPPVGCQEGRNALVEPAVVTSVGSPPVTGTRPTAVRVW